MTLGPNGYPIDVVEALRVYAPEHDSFFDYLVEFIGAFSGVYAALEAQRTGTAKAFGTHQSVMMKGTAATNTALSFFPFQVFDALSADSWPTELRMAEFALDRVQPDDRPTVTSLTRIVTGLLESSFVRYFEDRRGAVETRFGSDTTKWPSDWNFARVLRNAFAHGGAITFKNAMAQPVSWRNLTYSPADNGRVVAFVDVTAVELILLLEDLDWHLKPAAA